MPFDTAQHLPDLVPFEQMLIKERKTHAFEARRLEAATTREAWRRKRCKEIEEVAGASSEASLATLMRAQEEGVLGPDFVIYVELERDSGQFTCHTVAKIVADPTRFNGCRTLDFLDPDYDNRRPVGMLLLKGREKRAKSFARGETDYRLDGSLPVIYCADGGTREATDTALAEMRKGLAFYDFGDLLCVVDSGRIVAVGLDALSYHIESAMRFEGPKERRGQITVERIDAPLKVLRQLAAISAKIRQLKPLSAVSSIPSVRLDGSLVTSPGYDATTRIFFDFPRDMFPIIQSTPSKKAALRALARFNRLLRHFRFVSVGDRTAALCGFLTALIRPVVDVAPMIVIEATDASSGKTALARGMGTFALGEQAGVTAASTINNGDEGRKFITAYLLTDDARVLILDNARETQSSEALCVLLTAPYWKDRILGLSLIKGRIPNKTQVIMTGTNLSFVKELARRTITCRLEPRPPGAPPVEDLSRIVLAQRPELVTAGLTLIRAALASEEERAPGELDSFPDWDRLVRQTVAWIAKHLAPGRYVDPLTIVEQAIEAAVDKGEEATLFGVLRDIFGDRIFTSAEVAAEIDETVDPVRKSILKGLVDGNPKPSAKSVGRMLIQLRDRTVRGLTLRGHTSRGMMNWSVEEAEVNGGGASDSQGEL